jgi:protein-tyrosine phosphatase
MLAGGPLAVLDLTAESNAPTLFREQACYRSLPLLDLVKPADADIAKALAFIREQQPQRRVFVHCQLGLQRSALIVAHWLVENGGAGDLDGAKAIVHTRVPEVVLG